ncbi:DUF1108 family protein [Staphylococcus simulans]|uniref:DUF1108 family protein n=1 Tax=Staphylococcus simulans TaxID=1286 RepID=UPI000D03F200|nr:DUF1108 family protein [Staphylococcus simulans]MDQ7113556.1 DUF1108 family protein [Staphylococcus simulans]MDQ7117163.1 DUF1108 family protein [Staphylococcus simulans]PTJ01796.1 DUF1108 domain-containing protein [Staphylococcus simulans]UXV37094.1 DUF1108 family protein [Staphylococcus simulans]UXV39543.1 DUF1108 family protein [Staphylococcus simulans]
MFFEKGEVRSQYFNIDGFEFIKELTRKENHINLLISTRDHQYVTDIAVASLSDLETVEEIIKHDIYVFIEQQADELDKVMAYFTKGWL